MTDLLLIRHGEATHNLVARWEGPSAAPLTEEGRRQAEAVARRLARWEPRVCHLYSSPILRAYQTAEPIARFLGLGTVTEEQLSEIDFGQVSGLTREQFQARMPAVYARWSDRGDQTFTFPGGEQRREFFQRVARALDTILARHPRGVVAIVAHGGTLRAALAHLFPDTMSDWWAYSLDNGSLTHVQVGQGTPRLKALNDCQHLERDWHRPT